MQWVEGTGISPRDPNQQWQWCIYLFTGPAAGVLSESPPTPRGTPDVTGLNALESMPRSQTAMIMVPLVIHQVLSSEFRLGAHQEFQGTLPALMDPRHRS
jgi:hypothetical protein